jgi:hypothetical protein
MASEGDNDSDEHHYLDSFLQERLPALGLDYETYGSYVRGLVDEDDGDTNADVESDNTTWDEIMDLLQASSETHCDDSEVWISLKQEITIKTNAACVGTRTTRAASQTRTMG